ncbi:MAG: sugar phosphate isomerase/epimerase family protein [Anaerolineae bacterium]
MPIQYGAHCYLFTDRWSDTQLGLLETASDLGLDLWEIAVGDDVVFTPALTRRAAADLGLTLTVSPGGEWPIDCDLSADEPEARARGLDWHRRQVDVTAELGAVAYTGALYGHPGVVKRRIPPPTELPRTAEGLHALANYAQERDVRIVLEPMSHFRTHLVNMPDQVMHLLRLADHDNLYALLDTYHLVTEIRDYAAALRTVAPRLWGVHACENDRGVPGGGLVPWAVIFQTLKELAFEGVLMLETYNSSIGEPPGQFAHQRTMFHDPCPDGAAFVKKGLAFLKAGLGTGGTG